MYCPKCGAEIVGIPAKKMESEVIMTQPGHQQFEQATQVLQPLVQRNYLLWFLMSMLIPLFGLLYLYFCFEDLKKMDQYPKPQNVPSTTLEQNQFIIYIVLYVLGLGIIANYMVYSKKYGMFNDYLDAHPRKQAKLPSRNYIKLMIARDIMLLLSIIALTFGFMLVPAGLLIVEPEGFYGLLGVASGISTLALFIIGIVLCVLGGLMFIAISIIGIYQIVLDHRWQEAMNERVLILCPNAEMKSLF